MNIQTLIEEKENRIQGMIAYLKLKIDEKDWHGVADAAMDLRDLESEIRGIEETSKLFEASNTNDCGSIVWKNYY